MARTRMVVVGGDAAGMSAAAQARKRRPPQDLEIVAFERGRHTSYSACGLPYYAGDVVKDWRDLVARTPEEHAEQDIEVRTRHEVDAIDLESGRVRARDLAPVLASLAAWGTRHCGEPSSALATHAGCGGRVLMRSSCARCGAPVPPEALDVRGLR